ncbi:uncharacterized protein LOC142498154 [Ascaphus truei]|uniref:uncharacterized protein LOC142498154 n=1 Tax=Ascaphus truei TaxID=8439 RepID=UPI003F5A5B69
MAHIWWTCPEIQKYWSRVQRLLDEILGLEVPLDPLTYVLGSPMEDIPAPATRLIHIINVQQQREEIANPPHLLTPQPDRHGVSEKLQDVASHDKKPSNTSSKGNQEEENKPRTRLRKTKLQRRVAVFSRNLKAVPHLAVLHLAVILTLVPCATSDSPPQTFCRFSATVSGLPVIFKKFNQEVIGTLHKTVFCPEKAYIFPGCQVCFQNETVLNGFCNITNGEITFFIEDGGVRQYTQKDIILNHAGCNKSALEETSTNSTPPKAYNGTSSLPEYLTRASNARNRNYSGLCAIPFLIVLIVLYFYKRNPGNAQQSPDEPIHLGEGYSAVPAATSTGNENTGEQELPREKASGEHNGDVLHEVVCVHPSEGENAVDVAETHY